MSLDKINQLVNSIAKIVESSEKVAIPVLSVKLKKMAEVHPYDQTIVLIATILNKMDNNNKLFITHSEFKDLYNKYYSRNTKFAEYFQEELGQVEEDVIPVKKIASPIVKTHEHFTDPVLVNALSAAWDNTIKIKSYTVDLEKRAKYAVSNNLDVWNLRASKLDVAVGNEYYIIIKADYNTPKGITSILVPVEINKDKVVEPELFMCNAGPQELNNVNIKNYLTSFAGAKLKVRAEDVLNLITKKITGKEVISDVGMAVTKIASSKEKIGNFDGIIGQKVFESPRSEVIISKGRESESFAAKFASPSGIAEFKFGNDKINIGRNVIIRDLAGFGIKNPQIKVVACDESAVFYGVTLFGGKTSFKVPIKIANNKVSSPEIIICDGAISSFSKESISELLVNNSTDTKIAAATSPQHELNSAELIQNVKMAVTDGNYLKAEDALNILQQSGNVSAYKEAFVSYINGMGITKKAGVEQVCSMIIKSANSSYPLCGHTNLPTHKVYQDEHGNCHPNYRKGMKEVSDAVFFMNAKIFG